MATRVKRRLTTILCADAKSYGRLMESDEAATIGTLRQYRAAMDGLIARHEGRTVNTWGDAVIAEFGSVVEAVQCAVEIQRELSRRNGARPEAEQMWFRIGINLGDVMVEDDEDLYGEGVNIAARLQEMAEPGGILISSTVHDLVRNKLGVGFDFLGQQAVKNASEPVACYRVLPDAEGIAPAPRSPSVPAVPDAPGRLRAFLAALPRSVRVVAILIVFLFFVDLFSGARAVWFHWPAMVGVLFILLRLAWPRRSGKERP